MKIRFKVSVSGAHINFRPGQVVDWPESEARKWLEGGRAEIVVDEKPKAKPELKVKAKKEEFAVRDRDEEEFASVRSRSKSKD